MAEEPEENGNGGGEIDDEYIQSMFFRRNARLDPSVWVNEEQYSSWDIFINSREKITLGKTLDSRVQDPDVQREDAEGSRFHVPFKVLEPVSDLHRSLNRIYEAMERSLNPNREKEVQKARDKEEKAPDRVEIYKLDEAKFFELYQQKAGELDIELKPRRYWAVTPLMGEALPQSPRRPFFMIWKPMLDWFYQLDLDHKINSPDELVEYQYTGCFDPEQPDKDLNADLVAYIRTDPFGSDPEPGVTPSDPPFPMVRHEGKYKIPRKYEDERSITLRVHRFCSELTQTAEQVFHWEAVAKAHDPIPAEAEEKLLLEVTNEGRVLGAELATRQAKKRRSAYEKWLDRNFDRWLPSECYRFRERFFDTWSLHDDTWESKANRQWAVMCLSVHVESLPTVQYKTRTLDWTTFKAKVAPVENRRDIVRIFNHWKMTKNTLNARASGDIDKAAVKDARRNDHGGPWNGVLAKHHWRFMTLRSEAGADPVRALRLLGPLWVKREPWQMMDHNGSNISRFMAKTINFVEGTNLIRVLSSKNGLGQFPIWEELAKKELVDVRDYPEEYYWLLNDEYTTDDPVDAYEHQKGIIVFSTNDEADVRLEAESSYRNVPKMRLTYKNATKFKTFIMHMWYWQSVGPVRESILHVLEETEINHITDTLAVVVKHTEGLPCGVVPHIQKVDQDWQPVWKTNSAGAIEMRQNPHSYQFEMDTYGDPVLKKDAAGNPIPTVDLVRVPELLGPREEMELMIWELRQRCVDWLFDRMMELVNVGGQRNFKELNTWMAKNGFPFRTGNDAASKKLLKNAGYQTYLGPVMDTLQGIGEAEDSAHFGAEEMNKARESGLLSRKFNILVWMGKLLKSTEHRDDALRYDKAEQLRLWANFEAITRWESRQSEAKKLGGGARDTWLVADMIVKGRPWPEVCEKLVGIGKSEVERRRVWVIYETTQDRPIVEVDVEI